MMGKRLAEEKEEESPGSRDLMWPLLVDDNSADKYLMMPMRSEWLSAADETGL